MIKIILAESELEPIPEQIRSHRALKRFVKGKDVVLLDSNFHHSAMGPLEESYRRGRPDIVHVCLLNALDSPLNKTGGLELYIHTRNDKAIYISQELRVPRSYNRFVGLIEKLFREGKIEHEGNELLRLEDRTLQQLLDEVSEGMDIKLMHYRGDEYEHSDDCVIIVGGFPHGDFKNDLDIPKYSIFHDELMAWSVVNYVLYSL